MWNGCYDTLRYTLKNVGSEKSPYHKGTVSRGDLPVTARNPIPHDTFTEAVESLDRKPLAALVGEIYAATADEVSVDGPRITVVESDRQTELLVMSPSEDLDDKTEYGAVVTANDRLIADCDLLPADTAIVTPVDLRQRLLYAISPEKADAIATQFLDVRMRSTEYDAPSTTDSGAPTDENDTPVGTETDQQNRPRPNPDDITKRSAPVGTASTDQIAGTSADGDTEKTPRLPLTDALSPEALTDGDRRWILIGVFGIVALLGLAVIGAGFAGNGFITGDGDRLAGVDEGTAADPEPSELEGINRTTTDNDGGDATATGGTADRNLTNVTARVTSVAPTCERSAINVVQLQMNAFRYNNNTTNTGILTARQFASPSNRAAVGSADQFISLFDMPQYAPMLTYDTVQYSVPKSDGDTTTIDVVTRENGTVTGQYDFRLRKVPGDETGVNTTRDDAECWMTSGVRASPL